MIQVRDLMNIDYFKSNNMKLLAGEAGLDRVVTGANFIQLFTFDEWMKGGEFLLVNGIGLHLEKKENVLSIINKANNKNVACIIFLKNPYLKNIPEEAISLANNLSFPIFFIPGEPPFSECISIVYNHIHQSENENKSIEDITRNLIYSNTNSKLLAEELSAYGYDSSLPLTAVIIKISRTNSNDNNIIDSADANSYNTVVNSDNTLAMDNTVKNTATDYSNTIGMNGKVPYLIHNLYTYLSDYLSVNSHVKKPLFSSNLNSLTVFLPYTEKEEIKMLLTKATDNCKSLYKDYILRCFCGMPLNNPDGYVESFNQALKSSQLPHTNGNIIFFDELGLLKLCISISDKSIIEDYIYEIIGPLITYDKYNDTDMLKTLKVFSECNFNVTHASEALYLHRNTMIGRVKKIESILSLNLEDYESRILISTAIYLADYYLDMH